MISDEAKVKMVDTVLEQYHDGTAKRITLEVIDELRDLFENDASDSEIDSKLVEVQDHILGMSTLSAMADGLELIDRKLKEQKD